MSTPARVVVCPQEQAPLEVQEIDLPDPGPTQVVVRQFASGICHSQLHQMHRQRRRPTLLGHESTGVVIKKGTDVSHLDEGDIALVTWVPRDAGNATSQPSAATLDIAGGTAVSQNVFTWADHTIADEQYVVKAPADIARDVTSIIGCAVMTGAGAVVNTANVQAGDSVAIFGVGGVGLSAVVGAKMRRADPIIAVDLDETKLEFAKRFGATHGINASKVDAVEAIHAMTGNPNQTMMGGRPVTGVDFAFDCIGLKVTMEQIVPACRGGHFGVCQGGTAVLVGVPSTTVELNAGEILGQEKQFRGSIGGSCSPDRDFPMFLDWHAHGDLDLESLVTERYAIDDINEATTALEEGRISGRSILTFDS
ncbi:MAG: zinc-binding dehydrogenase [Gammaproteobacteria bacterium]|nr:zinc-binding dehydrogenase [Gammaproteobacteria bacterium]